LFPEDRFASAEEMSAALAALLGAPARERAAPESVAREVREVEQRFASLVAASSMEPKDDTKTEIFSRRESVVTEVPTVVEDPGLSITPLIVRPAAVEAPHAPGRKMVPMLVTAIGVLVAVSAVVGYRLATNAEQVSPAPIAAELSPPPVRPSVEAREALADPAPAEEKVIEKPRAKITPPPIETPAEKKEPVADEPSFDALARAAAELKAKHPELSKELDLLITDATMWRSAEASEASKKAQRRLRETLERLRDRAAR
jgi:hypothetical protein